MSEQRSFTGIVREHKTVLIILLVGLLIIELEIFALAVIKSGRKSWLQVLDQSGTVIHETSGSHLSEFNKYYFEKTFGPFENYQVRLKTERIPFPFRAWFVAAVGLPIGLMLLFGFIVKAYYAIFIPAKSEAPPAENGSRKSYETRLEMVLDKVSRLNIFLIGFFILAGVLLYWIVPNALTYLGKTGIDTIIRFKWVFIAAALALVGIVLWIIYLRYLLAKKSIETQTEIEKLRLQLEIQTGRPAALPMGEEPSSAPQVEWDGQPPPQP
ncbi:MAG: hypothetical protein QNJ22_15225 [Desulfosarcinaceae bacterium]|nr:hypothetical protein [Desulfosarcinaceae bacterium]